MLTCGSALGMTIAAAVASTATTAIISASVAPACRLPGPLMPAMTRVAGRLAQRQGTSIAARGIAVNLELAGHVVEAPATGGGGRFRSVGGGHDHQRRAVVDRLGWQAAQVGTVDE